MSERARGGVVSGPAYDGYHWLYRVYDAADRLLYIGRTHNPWQRIAHQSCTAHWRDEAERIEWEPIGPYHLATQAEIAAIKAEAPVFNVQHNRRVAS